MTNGHHASGTSSLTCVCITLPVIGDVRPSLPGTSIKAELIVSHSLYPKPANDACRTVYCRTYSAARGHRSDCLSKNDL